MCVYIDEYIDIRYVLNVNVNINMHNICTYMFKHICIVYSLNSEDSRIPIKIGSAQQNMLNTRYFALCSGLKWNVATCDPTLAGDYQHSDQADNFQPVTGSAEGSILHFSRLQ